MRRAFCLCWFRLFPALALALVACRAAGGPSSSRVVAGPPTAGAAVEPTDDAQSSDAPDERSAFRLYKLLQPIGVENDTRVRLADFGVEAKAIFNFQDRGALVPLAVLMRLAPDGHVRRYHAWGRT